MFKKITTAFKSFSLSRQLFLILGVIALGIFIGVAPLIDSNVKKIVDEQMFHTIENQQSQLKAIMIDGRLPSDLPLNLDKDDRLKVSHLLYDINTNQFEILSAKEDEDHLYLKQVLFSPTLAKMVTSNQTEGLYVQELSDNQSIYFVISQSEVSNHYYWISYAYSDISLELLGNIRNELVNVLYVVMMIIALLLTFWIYSLIKPLKEILNYIHSIKHQEKFELNISSKDEIGEVGEALKEMEAELNHQNQLQSDLIHNISHDLKTPIAIIRSYCECMQDDIYPYGDKNSSLDVVIENADRLEKKVKDFLYLNRLDYLDEKTPIETMTNVGEIARHILDELMPLNEHIRFIVDIEDVSYMGEYEHWYSALMNVIDNALRYARSVIKVTVGEDFIQIFNDGSPIEESLKQEIFKPYTKGEKGNYGLGMSIVYKIVTMYHCDIMVENIDDGVVFIISKQKK